MKIEYAAMGSSSWATLVDPAAGGTFDRWDPDYDSKPQIEELASNVAQGAGVFTNPLGNVRATINLQNVYVTYATPAAALAASRTVPAAFLYSLIKLRLTEGAEVQYLADVVTTKCKPNVAGIGVTFQFAMTASGTPSASDPG